MVEVAVVAAEAKDAVRAPALACHGIAHLIEGTHVAVAFPATRGHVPVTFDAGGAVATLEQRLAGTLPALPVAFGGIAASWIAVARQTALFQGISVMSWFTFVAFPAFRVTATLEAAPGFLIAGAAAAETGLARATRYQRISKESYVTALAMIAGVTVWTLRAHVSAIYVGGVIELTVWTEIVALDQKWAAASFAIVRCALQSNTVKTGRAAIAFRAHGVVFAGCAFSENKIAGTRVPVAIAFYAHVMILIIRPVFD